jgi:CheY-like chemotaxis protein
MSTLRSVSVLLVDDHDDTLKATARLLRAEGYTVHAARTATEATTLAAGGCCEILVSDVGLPDRSGIELMRELKSLYGLKGIAVTGFAGATNMQEALDAGFSRHLAKPIIFSDLLKAIREVSGARPGAK